MRDLSDCIDQSIFCNVDENTCEGEYAAVALDC